ncbi:hemerythrin domain-containing protein [Pseudoduganella namucuonensis]|uniref:Hemerythrin HHE cation binding domain-containing protein n=1 Tax=Pseudoduganella namucuonensis TaxID=1035707 RepID=A0A1I7JU98_9BURK|nr:hemerythrin domain-containing protein [Pseudoduganella namucuonensis]SFU88781.1 Hemerythrin HHE cation binding domain-containing protein [Pseudoduganella namucuonensis]
MFSLKSLSPTITDMIRFDHSHVLVTYHQYTADKPSKVGIALAETICSALDVHATLEEEIFYPALRAVTGGEPILQKSVPEHNAMRQIIADLRAAVDDDERRDELLPELMREVMHHMADEETVLLPKAERLLDHRRLCELGADMTKRRVQLLAPQAGKVAANTALGFSRSTSAIVAGVVGVAVAAGLVMKGRRRAAA